MDFGVDSMVWPMDWCAGGVGLDEMRGYLVFAVLRVGLSWSAFATAEEAGGSDVVSGYQSKRVRAVPQTIQVERLVIRGRLQKPHLVFHVKVPFRFDVGTSRLSYRPEERRRVSRPLR
jgi:hypothetical protein